MDEPSSAARPVTGSMFTFSARDRFNISFCFFLSRHHRLAVTDRLHVAGGRDHAGHVRLGAAHRYIFIRIFAGNSKAPGTERIRCHRRRVSGSSSGRFGGGYFGWAFPKEFNVILFSPLPGQYFASIMIIVGMSVIATVVVLQYHHHDPNGGNMPKWVRLLPHSHTALLSSPF